VIAWSNGSRFLVDLPQGIAGGGTVGFDAQGNEVVIEGARLVHNGGPAGISLAVIPLSAGVELSSNELVARFDGNPVSSELLFGWQLAGLSASNQAGLIGVRAGAENHASIRTDVAGPGDDMVKDLSGALRGDGVVPGVERNIEKINDAVLQSIYETFGGKENVPDDLFVLWFDPIDYILADEQGAQLSQVGSTSVNRITGSFYSGNQVSELLVVPNARSDFYTLTLVGLGQGYRGAATLLRGGELHTAPLYGRLDNLQNVSVVMDFRDSPVGSPFSGLGLLTADSRGGTEVVGALGQAVSAALGRSSTSTVTLLAAAGQLLLEGAGVSAFDDPGSGGDDLSKEGENEQADSSDEEAEGDSDEGERSDRDAGDDSQESSEAEAAEGGEGESATAAGDDAAAEEQGGSADQSGQSDAETGKESSGEEGPSASSARPDVNSAASLPAAGASERSLAPSSQRQTERGFSLDWPAGNEPRVALDRAAVGRALSEGGDSFAPEPIGLVAASTLLGARLDERERLARRKRTPLPRH